MGRLRDWWDRLRGADDEPPHAAGRPKRPVQPSSPAQSSDGLQLAEAPGAARPSRQGEAGFDPYGNDAGFAKPHSWERIDHD